MKPRSSFGSRFGAIAVVGGSVVGLGNIWRFPYIAGENGGAAFILVYITLSLLICIPIMLTEFSIGRHTRSNALRAFRRLSPRGYWNGAGYLGIATSTIILSFYTVIAGWALHFLKVAITGGFLNQNSEQIRYNFDNYIAQGTGSMFWTFLFIAFIAFIVMRGVEKGIEKFGKVVMPFMILLLIGLVINSMTLDGAKEGISFLLRPDFGKINGHVVLQALGQAFFSLSLGMGTIITYGSYIPKHENMFRMATTIAITDTCVAILAGLAIFPAVFSYGINPTSGPELVFITLPTVFGNMAGGYVLGILFFFLLFTASISSSVSLLEVATLYISEEMHLRRRTATLIAVVVVAALSSLCLWSQLPDSSLRVLGMNIFDLFNNLTSLYMLPLGGLLSVLFAGWFMRNKTLQDEVTSRGRYGSSIYPYYRVIVRFVAPVVIVLLFLDQLNVI